MRLVCLLFLIPFSFYGQDCFGIKGYAPFKVEMENGLQKIWYENGQLQLERNVENHITNGLQKEWYENGQLQSETNYKDGWINGLSRFWPDTLSNPEANYYRGYKSEIYFKCGDKDGLYRTWYINGQLNQEWNYKNGNRDGLQRTWFKNGQLQYETNYKDGIQDGLQKQWFPNGQLKYERNYKEGKEIF